MRLSEVIKKYGLDSHPEGGLYREMYRSSDSVMLKRGERSTTTTIYYLLRAREFSAWHRILSDETWAHLQGDADLRIHMINEKGDYSQCILGKSREQAVPLFTVPAKVWFAVETLPSMSSSSSSHAEDHYALTSCIVSPGFHWEDFEMAEREKLVQQFPSHQEVVTRLTRLDSEAKQLAVSEKVSSSFSEKPIQRVAILVAMPSEAEPIVAALKLQPCDAGFPPEYGVKCYRGIGRGREVFCVLNGPDMHNKIPGIGTTAATINAMLTIEKLQPDLIVSVGVAGGYADTGARIGDVYIGSELVYHDRGIPLQDLSRFGQGRYVCLTLPEVREQLDLKLGIVATGNQFLDATKRASLPLEARPVVEDMECAAIGAVVDRFPAISMIALKMVVNLTGLTLEEEVSASKDFDDNTSTGAFKLATTVEAVLQHVIGKTPSSLREEMTSLSKVGKSRMDGKAKNDGETVGPGVGVGLFPEKKTPKKKQLAASDEVVSAKSSRKTI